MKKIFFILLISTLILIAGCSKGYSGSATKNLEEKSTVTQKEETPLEIGNKKGNRAIDFTVVTLDGFTISLSDYVYNKKPLMLYFFATWCPFCAKDFAALRNVYPEYKDKVEFLAVDLDMQESKEVIEEYKSRMGLKDITFALGNPKILTDYNIRATTTKFAIAKNGTILWTGSGAVDANTWRIIFEGLRKS